MWGTKTTEAGRPYVMILMMGIFFNCDRISPANKPRKGDPILSVCGGQKQRRRVAPTP
ncbi:MAG: hypothetical protein WA865_20955 [Spirulinaceae cyanobacterium]